MKVKVPAAARRLLEPVAERAAELGLAVYVVGGAVRDWLLGRTTYDLDLVVEGDPRPLARETARRLKLEASGFDAFGTVRLGAHGRLRLDFAAARRETYAEPAALPVVEHPVSIVEDLRRRDFTINAVAYRLTPGPRELVDPYGGLADLSAGLIRTLHPQSFRDDPTRVFRAARYAARLSYKPAPGLEAAAAEALERGWAAKLSRHRLAQELLRVLVERHPAEALRLLERWGYLSLVSPVLSGFSRWPQWEGLDAYERLGAVALSLPPEAARELLSSLPLERAKISWLEPALSAAAEARSPAKAADPRAARAAKAARLALPPAALKARLARGSDLEALGLKPGPRYKELLDEAASLQWRGRLRTRKAAQAWLRKRAGTA